MAPWPVIEMIYFLVDSIRSAANDWSPGQWPAFISNSWEQAGMRISLRFPEVVLLILVAVISGGELSVQAGDLSGKDLFTRKWVSHDQRSGGDGLGPMHNASSCATCHELGGPGGAGGLRRNV